MKSDIERFEIAVQRCRHCGFMMLLWIPLSIGWLYMVAFEWPKILFGNMGAWLLVVVPSVGIAILLSLSTLVLGILTYWFMFRMPPAERRKPKLASLLVIGACIILYAAISLIPNLRLAYRRGQDHETARAMAINTKILERYYEHAGNYPLAGQNCDLSVLKDELGQAGKEFVVCDGYYNPMRYYCSSDGRRYMFVSDGRKGKLNHDLNFHNIPPHSLWEEPGGPWIMINGMPWVANMYEGYGPEPEWDKLFEEIEALRKKRQ